MMILNIKTNQQFLSVAKQIYEQRVKSSAVARLLMELCLLSARNFVTVL